MNTPEERARMVAGVEGWIRKEVKRRVVRKLGWSHYDDACQLARIKVWKCSKYYKPERTKFITYASRSVHYAIVEYLKANQERDEAERLVVDRDWCRDYFKLLIGREPDPADVAELQELREIVRREVAGLEDGTGRKRNYKGRNRVLAIGLRYGLIDGYSYSQKATGRILGVTKQMARQSEYASLQDLSASPALQEAVT